MIAAPQLPRWRVFPPLALGTLMATLDLSIVNIALPTLARTFAVPLTTVEWVVLAYSITVTGLLLTLGRLADRLGRRRMYGLGLLVFTAASALCAAAPTASLLIAARALQGLGAAMMTANSAALLVGAFPAEQRGRAIGAFGAMVGVGLALGPPLGGLLVGHLSWRSIFLLNLPLGVLALAQLRRRVPDDPPRPEVPAPAPLDAALACAALVLLTLGLSRGPASGWRPVAPLFLASLAALTAFVVRERRSPAPHLPHDLLRGSLGVGAALTFLGQALSVAIGFAMPLYLEGVLGFDAAQSGRWLSVLPLLALVMAPAAGRWADRAGPRPLSMIGLAIAAAGYVVLSGLGTGPPPGTLLAGLALVGAGLGLFTVPNSSAVLGAVPPERLGSASGLQATMRNLGVTAGAAASAAIVTTRQAAHGAVAPGSLGGAGFDRAAFARAHHDLNLSLAAVAVLAALFASRHGSRPIPPPAC